MAMELGEMCQKVSCIYDKYITIPETACKDYENHKNLRTVSVRIWSRDTPNAKR
jgi:hypothetical protein